jgi:hypothetical protein
LADVIYEGSSIKLVASVSFNRVVSSVVDDISYASALSLTDELHAHD